MMVENKPDLRSPTAAANAFQFALLIVQMAVRLLGRNIMNEIISRNVLGELFEIENGGLKNIFPLDNPRAEEYFRRLLEATRLVLEKSFGKEFVKNAFREKYGKVKSWAQSKQELEMLNSVVTFNTDDKI